MPRDQMAREGFLGPLSASTVVPGSEAAISNIVSTLSVPKLSSRQRIKSSILL